MGVCNDARVGGPLCVFLVLEVLADVCHTQADREQIGQLVACALDTIFRSSAFSKNHLPQDAKLVTAFHSEKLPDMSLVDYLLRYPNSVPTLLCDSA